MGQGVRGLSLHENGHSIRPAYSTQPSIDVEPSTNICGLIGVMPLMMAGIHRFKQACML